MPRQKRKAAEQFISPNDAIAAIIQYAGNEFQAKQVISDGLLSGKVRAIADWMWERTGGDPDSDGEALRRGGRSIEQDIEIHPDSWKSSRTWPAELRYWNWEEGNFVVCLTDPEDDRPIRGYFHGVRLLRDNILALVGRTARTGAGGPKSDRDRWARVWIEIVLNTSRGYDWTKFENRYQLRQEIASWCDDEFSESTLSVAVEKVWENIVLRRAAENRADDLAS